jgi:hypothetical protein
LCPADQQLDAATRVKPASEDQKLSGILSNRSVHAERFDLGNNSIPGEPSSQQRVRQPSLIAPASAALNDLPSPPAHPSNRLIAQLNTNWRIVDDPLQWILQRRKGNPRKKNSGWQDRSFCTTRDGLLRCVREYCGEVDQTAIALISAQPAHHATQILDVHRTDQAQAIAQSDPLPSKELDDCESDVDRLRSGPSALY